VPPARRAAGRPETSRTTIVEPSPRGRVEATSQVAGDRDDQQQVEADVPNPIGSARRRPERESPGQVDRCAPRRRASSPARGRQRRHQHTLETVQVRKVAIAHGAFEHRAAQRLAVSSAAAITKKAVSAAALDVSQSNWSRLTRQRKQTVAVPRRRYDGVPNARDSRKVTPRTRRAHRAFA